MASYPVLKIARRGSYDLKEIRTNVDALHLHENTRKLSVASPSTERTQPRNTEPARTASISTSQVSEHGGLSRYQYEPLNSTQKCIRLLQVLPGEPQQPIRCCTIQHHDLLMPPSYIALSYMGSREKESFY